MLPKPLHLTTLPGTQHGSATVRAVTGAPKPHAGKWMGNLDMMIGAHALALDLILITNDHAFRRIKKLRGEDWTKP